jgi:surface polysaccharide O-acyltransferase-like enzyme
LCLLALPIVIIKIILDAAFPSHTDGSETLVWFTLYWYGWLFMRDRTLWADVASQAVAWLAVGMMGTSLLGVAFWNGLLMQWLDHPAYTWDYVLFQILAAVNTWAWVIAIAGLCLRRLNFEHRLLGVLGPATLPFYILHQTPIFTIGFWIVQTGWIVPFKLITIAVSSLLATTLICQLLIRHGGILRRLFGMRSNGWNSSEWCGSSKR